jgi:hypothetical protein
MTGALDALSSGVESTESIDVSFVWSFWHGAGGHRRGRASCGSHIKKLVGFETSLRQVHQ